jgi:hypothetical protein
MVAREGGWAGLLRLPIMFRRAGADTYVLSPKGCIVRRSIYLKGRFNAPGDPEGLTKALHEHLRNHKYDWIILGDEPTLVAIAADNTEGGTWRDGWFPVADLENGIPLITSKTVFTAAAPNFGIPVPQSRVCNNLAEVRAAVEQLGFPLMFKCARGFASNGVAKVRNSAEALSAFERFEARLPLVVQQFVEGRLGSTQMMFDHGKPICWVPAYKPVCWPEPFGTSCVREMLDQQSIDAMKPIVDNIGRMTEFHGLCGMDWIQQADGSFRILEFNPRPTTVMHLGPLSGVDCTDSIRAMLRGQELVQNPKAATQARVYMFPQFLRRAVRDGRWSDFRYYVPFVAYHDIPWEEPGFVVSHLWGLMKLTCIQMVGLAKGLLTRKRPAPSSVPARTRVRDDLAEEVAV